MVGGACDDLPLDESVVMAARIRRDGPYRSMSALGPHGRDAASQTTIVLIRSLVVGTKPR